MDQADDREGLLRRLDMTLERNSQAIERNSRAWGHTVGALAAIRESLDEMRDEIRAQTQAIWQVLDRLESGEQGA